MYDFSHFVLLSQYFPFFTQKILNNYVNLFYCLFVKENSIIFQLAYAEECFLKKETQS